MRDVKVIIVNFQKLLITKHIYLFWHGRPIGNSREKNRKISEQIENL